MRSISAYLIITAMFLVMANCNKPTIIDKEKVGNCADGIQNQGEKGVDCGGPCRSCATCDDGIKNQNETGIDCGGPCLSCLPSCSLTSATFDYTITASGSSSLYTGLFSSSLSQIDLTPGGFSPVTGIRIEFVQNFNVMSYIPLNETMVFSTSNSSSLDYTHIQKVRVLFFYNIGFNGYSDLIDWGQNVYITKISSTSLRVQFCNLKSDGSNHYISANSIVN